MQQDCLNNVSFLVGTASTLDQMHAVSYEPFSDRAINFLDFVSRQLRADSEAKTYADIQTFAIWARRTSLEKMKASYGDLSNRQGRGITFHIAPSNIPLMFMFSLAVSLLAGNPNIIRISSKDFGQTPILIKAIKEAVRHDREMENVVVIVRYAHEKEATDYFSAICRSRVIWGGDHSILQIRQSELPASAIDMPFYDRFSLSVINAPGYLEYKEKERLAERFYNDTYLTDQNACTSPQLVIWTGNHQEEAKHIFWDHLESVVEQKYAFQSVQAVDKLCAAARAGAAGLAGRMVCNDMRLVRIALRELTGDLKNYRCPGGYFYEYSCDHLSDMKHVCGTECQTISYFGLDREDIIKCLREEKCAGADRVVPIGATMDFGLHWDGFDFIYFLSRVIA